MAICHILDQSVQQKVLNVLNVDVNNIFQKFDGPSSSLSKSAVPVYINNRKFHALIYSGSTDNFIHRGVIDWLSLNVIKI